MYMEFAHYKYETIYYYYYILKLPGKQHEQNASPKSCNPEIKILANPGLA